MRLGAEHSAEESSGCAGERSLEKLLSKEGREGNSSCSLGSRTSVSQRGEVKCVIPLMLMLRRGSAQIIRGI